MRITVAAREIRAVKLSSVLQQRMAIHLNSLRFPENFSISYCHFQVSRLNSVGKRRMDLGGLKAGTRYGPADRAANSGQTRGRQGGDRRSAPRSAPVVGRSGPQTEAGPVAWRVGQGHDLGDFTATRAPDGLALAPPFAPCK